MLSADERIVLIRVKIERAKKHLQNLAADILATERRDVFIRNEDAKSGESRTDVIKISFRQGFPTDVTPLCNVPRFSTDVLTGAGDIAHNLRSSLDHLMCHLLLVAKSKITPRDGFPISESLDRYKSRRAGLVNRVGNGVIDALDALNPYKGGNDSLWRIHELDRIDKHRTIFTLAHDVLLFADWIDGDFLLHKDAPDGAGIYDLQDDKELQFDIEKSLRDSQIPLRDAVLPTMHQLIDFVDDLIPIFKPYLG